MLIKEWGLIIKGCDLCSTITNQCQVLEIEHNYIDEGLYNFKTVLILENDQALRAIFHELTPSLLTDSSCGKW